MNKTLMNKQRRIFDALSNAGLILVQSSFPIERRTVFGLHNDSSDLAISLKWHDTEGCEWEADFTEGNLTNASVTQNRITLNDSVGENVCVELYALTPGKF